MIKAWKKFLMISIVIATAGLFISNEFVNSQEKKDMGGWEKDSAYNKLYVATERDKFKAVVVGFKEIVPFPGMSPGIALLVRDPDEDIITVHLGPKWYIDSDEIGIRKGDNVTIRGVWVEGNEEEFFIASKVKRGDYFEFKVRLTKDGTPFWTMSPEEIAKESQNP
ncbi:MAG: hypothetical protein JW786_08980 [Desulfobacterales bacterium]|nr:hypothetical protein [Desulfobacterales bacterium]